jgi:hypothetical protein
MTPLQRTALDHPCYLAGETMHPRFDARLVIGTPISVKVTVNAGYE